MRIVFDTNVLFAAFIAHGACAGLYEECLVRGEIVVSREILNELEEKLIAKAKFSKAEALGIVRAVRADAEVVDAIPLSERICRDADDDWILAAALTARADFIVTGDQDLLVLKSCNGIRILNPREALARLAAS